MNDIWLTLIIALQIFSCLRSFFIRISSTVLCKSPYSVWIQDNIALVIKQKGESQNGCYKKTKQTKFSKNEHFLPPHTHTHVCISAGKKCSFFRKFSVLCFLFYHLLRDSPFGQSSSSEGPPCCWSFSIRTEIYIVP